MGKGNRCFETRDAIVLENASFRLTIGKDALPMSLLCLSSGEECLRPDVTVPLFSVTQERPFVNEIKLATPNTRTTYPANRLRLEGDDLIVGFETAPYEASVRVGVTDSYMTFTLTGFMAPFGYSPWMDKPPVSEFRLLQLPLKERREFGEWLNVMRDGQVAAAVMGVTPRTMIGSEKRDYGRVLFAAATRELHLIGTSAALIADVPASFLDRVEALERDFDLPRGVASRRGEYLNASVYFTSDLCPQNLDEHIRRCKQGGFRLMQIYYTSMFEEEDYLSLIGNYDYRAAYPNGREDLAAMLQKIKEAGIIPGLHVLQTHIGLKSRYVTPVADHRLHLTRHFTLAKDLDAGTDTEADTVFVEEDSTGAVMANGCRVLSFGGELISYEGYVTEPPFRFTGCVRGAYRTKVKEHPIGEIGGIPDISEAGGQSVYLDQRTSLADEIAAKIADVYNAGFEFLYFDGSEGVHEPFGYHVSAGQYRVWEKLEKKPLFCEGAAKSHFGWHFLSGGNAFDIFPAEVFKKMIVAHPMEEVVRMKNDFTRVNFGWWAFALPDETTMGTQADLIEYGLSRGAGWDCPATIQNDLGRFNAHPRTDDILEVFRRWEDVRQKGWLTSEMKEKLRDPATEHHLFLNEQGEYELLPYRQISVGVGDVRAFLFEREGLCYVLFWHIRGACDFTVDLGAHRAEVFRERKTGTLPLVHRDGKILLHAGNRLYLVTDATPEETEAAFAAGN